MRSNTVPGARGLALPLILVLLSALWMVALSTLALSTIERRRARRGIDDLQARMAMEAGFEAVLARLGRGCANDDYLVVASPAPGQRAAPLLHLLQPSCGGNGLLQFEDLQLFSCPQSEASRTSLATPPSLHPGSSLARLRTHPWLDPVEVGWLPVTDPEGKVTARYAFWVEDLQGLLDPRWALDGDPAAGFGEPLLVIPSLRALGTRSEENALKRLAAGRSLLVSPSSTLAAAGFQAPLERITAGQDSARAGRLVNPWADALERNLAVGIQPYLEQPRVPFTNGLSPDVMGMPKLNLNQMLGRPSSEAVDEMARWIRVALPDFVQRGGGFPEDYLKTLAACALDYADGDGEPIVGWGSHLGIDGQPFLSEVVLHLHFQRLIREDDRWVLRWTLRLFAELWNPTSQPIAGGMARLSYEVNLRPTEVGYGDSRSFDDPALLDDPNQSQHALERVGGIYLSPEVGVDLPADGYRFYEFARVDYHLDCTPQLDGSGQPLPEWFDLAEPLEEARGLTLYWNGRPVQRLSHILRDPYGLADFRTDRSRKTAKACIPGLNYGSYGAMVNNPGDVRMAHYLRALPVGENAYPENVSPHRRNIRRRNIYDRDPSPLKTRHYGRVMPSEWADGGHDSATGDFFTTTGDAALPTDPDKWPIEEVPASDPALAPQRLSNAGRFFSVTEWGRIHDPLMWTPAYSDLEGLPGSGEEDTAILTGRKSIWLRPALPTRRGRWPEVSRRSTPSSLHGGGNTLRIGRAEHPLLDRPGWRASHLLDLFHCGQPFEEDESLWGSPLIRVAGRVNLNTAPREVLRCLVYGELRQDPALARVVDPAHDTAYSLHPHLQAWSQTPGQLDRIADEVADGILRHRPFASPSELIKVTAADGGALFGNPRLHAPGESLQWSDAAAEELFARVHDAACVRSRNFRVWVVGQSLASGRGGHQRVLATSRRVFTVFVDPGERNPAGELIPENQSIRILHVRNF